MNTNAELPQGIRTMKLHARGCRWISVVAWIALTACSSSDGDDRDETAPTVSVNAVSGSVNRTVSLGATASDNVGVTSVDFRVDGNSIGTASASPFTVQWNTGAVADGAHAVTAIATDAAGNSTTSSAVNVTVQNQAEFNVTLSGNEEIPQTGSTATGSGTVRVNLASGAVSGTLDVTGFTVTAAHIHDGFAGTSGPVVVGLEPDASIAGRLQFPAAASLTPTQVDRLLAGGLYLNAHSAQFQGGEVRGQILPANVSLFFTALSSLQEIPETTSLGQGVGAITVNETTRVAQIHLNVTGVANANAAHLHRGSAGTNGPVAVGLTQDTASADHWFVDNATLTQQDFDALRAAQTYLNIHTPANAGGEIRGQVVPSGFIVIVSRVNGEQEPPVPQITSADGTAAITVNTSSGATEIHVNVSGADDATAAHVHDGFAGVNGPVLVGLEKDPAAAGHWRSNGATLTTAQIETLQAGGLYANVHTPAVPAGFVRGQLLPSGVELVVTHLTGTQESTPVVTTDTARAFTTVNPTAKRLTTHVHTTGLDDSTAAHIHVGARGVAGPVSIGLEKDPANAAHWSASAVEISDAQLQAYRAGNLYINVHTPANAAGEVRGQIELGGVVPFRFEEIQQNVFNAICVACHTGVGAPVGLRLEASESHANLVDVASTEVPALRRVQPGNAPNSYLIRKLEGAPGIVGARMPLGQPALPPGVIERIRAWINAGALSSPIPPAPDTEAPVVTLGAVAASISGTVTLTATATDNVGVTLVRFRVNGTEVGNDSSDPYSFDWNSTTVANGAVTVDAQAVDAANNVGTSSAASATVSNVTGPTPFTFTEIQSQIFTPTCAVSGCHTGGSPAGGMDLSAPAFARIVNVASTEVPALMRINPGNAADSYMIRKLEGAPGIIGQRMPFGGPFLDQATIDRIRAWVDSGAPNN